MSYYTLPKHIVNYEIKPIIDDTPYTSNMQPVISFSLVTYLQKMENQIKEIQDKGLVFPTTNEEIVHFLNKMINPYEFIYTTIPNTKLSVSKLKPYSKYFYTFMEIMHIFNLLDLFVNKNIHTFFYGPNSEAMIEYLEIFREDMKDYYNKSTIHIEKVIAGFDTVEYRCFTYDFLYYELNDDDYKNENYITCMTYILCHLICYQSNNGVAIIKFDNIYCKPILDILYILNGIYDKIYIIKPSTTNVINNERYVICKKFIYNLNKTRQYYLYFLALNVALKTKKKIISLSNEDVSLPLLFVNKIEESNIIIGHQQLEYMDQLINLYKNKNKEEKIDLLKKIIYRNVFNGAKNLKFLIINLQTR